MLLSEKISFNLSRRKIACTDCTAFEVGNWNSHPMSSHSLFIAQAAQIYKPQWHSYYLFMHTVCETQLSPLPQSLSSKDSFEERWLYIASYYLVRICTIWHISQLIPSGFSRWFYCTCKASGCWIEYVNLKIAKKHILPSHGGEIPIKVIKNLGMLDRWCLGRTESLHAYYKGPKDYRKTAQSKSAPVAPKTRKSNWTLNWLFSWS